MVFAQGILTGLQGLWGTAATTLATGTINSTLFDPTTILSGYQPATETTGGTPVGAASAQAKDGAVSVGSSIVNGARQFKNGAARIYDTVMHPEVQRNHAGQIIGPRAQFILSNGRSPFNAVRALKVAGFLFLALHFVPRTAAFKTTHNGLSLVDSVFDTAAHLADTTLAGDPEWDWGYLEGYWSKKYAKAPGPEYIQRVLADPTYGRLFDFEVGGYKTLFGLDVPELSFQGIVRDQTLFGVSSLTPTTLFRIAMTLLGGFIILKSYNFFMERTNPNNKPSENSPLRLALSRIENKAIRKRLEQFLLNHPDRISYAVGLIYLTSWMTWWAAGCLASDTSGMHQFTPNAIPSILGDWYKGDLRLNWDRFAAYWEADITAAPLWAGIGVAALALTHVIYATLGDRVHARPSRNRFHTFAQTLFQRVNSGEDQGGKILPSYTLAQNVRAFTQDEKAGLKDPPPLFAETVQNLKAGWLGRVDETATAALGLGSAALFATGFGDVLLKGKEGDLLADVPMVITALVTGGALIFSGRSKQFWNSALALAAGGLAYKGAESAIHLASNGNIRTLGDATFMALGGGISLIGAAAMAGVDLPQRLFRTIGHAFDVMFSKERLGYWLALTLIAGTTTAGLSVATEYMQGYDNRGGYMVSIGATGYIGPNWVNRLGAAAFTGLTGKSLSLWGFFSSGWIPVYVPVRAEGLTKQTAENWAITYAQDYVFSGEEGQRLLIAQMQNDLELVGTALENKGWGRPDVLERAEDQFRNMQDVYRNYGIPIDEASTDDGLGLQRRDEPWFAMTEEYAIPGLTATGSTPVSQ